MQKYSLLIVEDHTLIRFGLRTAFESKDFISEIYEAANAEDAIELAKIKEIDVIIMDLGLPNIDGIEATKQIKELLPSSKIIILTSHNSEEEVLESIRAGASAYCSKDVNPEKLTNIVSSVIDGAAWFSPNVAQVVLNAATQESEKAKQAESSQEDYNLTTREKQVLKLIREGYNNNEIAKKLFVSINTAKVHVSSIIQKLGVEDRTKAAIKALNDNII